MMAWQRRRELRKRYCSFCEKEQATVEKMIVGPYGHICNECVDKFYAELHPSRDAAVHEEKK